MSSPAAQPARFQAGFAHRLITPPVGTSLARFFHDRVSRWLSVDAGRRMIDGVLVMLQDLWGETAPLRK